MPEPPERPKIAVVSHLYPHRGQAGYGVFVAEQVRALSGVGATVTQVVALVPWAPWPLPELSDKWRAYSSAERHRTDPGNIPVDFPRYLSFPRKMLRTWSTTSAIRAIRRDEEVLERLRAADVIVAHTALLDGAVARSLASSLAIPYVVFVHGEDLYQNVRADNAGRLRGRVGSVLSDAAAVVVVSSAVAGGIREAFPALRDVRVLHNGVDTEMFAPVAAYERASVLRILSASHLVERKAHAYVLRALARVAEQGVNIEYTIAGNGPERARIEALATELNLGDRVRFIGAYRHEALPGLMHDADLFVLPSWDEAFGVVYLEALASGVPVVAASDEGAADIVEHDVDGFLVPPRDIDAIAAALSTFAQLDDGKRAAMRAAARAKALRFTWERNARSLERILGDVVATS